LLRAHRWRSLGFDLDRILIAVGNTVVLNRLSVLIILLAVSVAHSTVSFIVIGGCHMHSLFHRCVGPVAIQNLNFLHSFGICIRLNNIIIALRLSK